MTLADVFPAYCDYGISGLGGGCDKVHNTYVELLGLGLSGALLLIAAVLALLG